MARSIKAKETPTIEPAPVPAVAPKAQIFNITASIEKGDGPKGALLRNRIIKVDGAVNAEMANNVTTELLYHEISNPGVPITLLINSGGGSISDGWAIIDTMHSISSPVHTCVVGRAMSMGATILMAGAKGHRSAMPNSRIMIHEGTISGVDGQASDVSIEAYEMESTRKRLLDFYVASTGAPRKKLASVMTRDYYMYGQEAVEMGIIDNVMTFPSLKTEFNTAAKKSNLDHQANRKVNVKPAP